VIKLCLTTYLFLVTIRSSHTHVYVISYKHRFNLHTTLIVFHLLSSYMFRYVIKVVCRHMPSIVLNDNSCWIRVLYLKIQSVPHQKRPSPWLWKPVTYCSRWQQWLYVLRTTNKTHTDTYIHSVGRTTYLMLKLLVYKLTIRLYWVGYSDHIIIHSS
jgi:hypothetical protein